MIKNNLRFWHFGIIITLILSSLLGHHLFMGDKSFFLAGDATHGHHQIELECSACHTRSFADKQSMQTACESCHAKELKAVNDSHPKKKFSDPRNASLLQELEATQCVSCHTEHKPEITRELGVTIASDFCFHCHKEIAEERPSHKEFTFDSCANSGCHNYHDNSMLYENFLIKHINEPALKKRHQLPARTNLIRWLKQNTGAQALSIEQANYAATSQQSYSEITQSWHKSIHAKTQVNCSDCHSDASNQNVAVNTENKIFGFNTCKNCHEKQAESFTEGLHGMRLGLGLSRMTTDTARQPMSEEHKSLDCVSCHNPHSLDVQSAAVDACMGCHQDEHTKNYTQSKHFQLWLDELSGKLPAGSGVTCASCHLPRVKKGKKVTVNHNQSANLRPNTKMLKKVCMTCHGLEFSLNALADEKLIQSNFHGIPDTSLQTFELIQERIEKRKKKSSN